jgi:SAM-dependent methyltransferase
MAKARLKTVDAPKLLKLNLGSGPNKMDGFISVDSRPFDGKVDLVHDLTKRWPWKDDSVDEVHASHFIEHLDAKGRIHFVNELYRVLRKDAKATIIVPHWASNRAYGDLTHQWPPVSEMWFYYLDKNWRAQNAPHNDFYTCDFMCTWGYSMHPAIQSRNQEYQQHAMSFFKEACQDTVATMVKR